MSARERPATRALLAGTPFTVTRREEAPAR
jgi:hypothetical protein